MRFQKALLSRLVFLPLIALGALIILGVVGGAIYAFVTIGSPPYGILATDRWMNDSPVAFLAMLATFLAAATSLLAAWVLWETLNGLREANQIMRDEQRPWLAFSAKAAGSLQRGPNWRSGDSEIRIRLEVSIENRGRLPAKDVNCRYAVTIADKTAQPDFSSASLHDAESSNVIAPGSRSTLFISCPIRLIEVQAVAPSPSERFLPAIKLEVTYASDALSKRTAQTEFRFYRRGKDGSFPRMALEDLSLPPRSIYIRQKDGPAT